MKFLSDILAKAGLTVDGVVTFNNTATGQTPATNDNSTKLATTAFIKNQSYLTANQTITVSGDATGSGTTSIALTLANSGVTAGTYGNASNIPTITVDAKGRITSISTNAVSIITTLAGLSDVTLTSPSTNQVLQYNGTRWVNGPAPTTYTLPSASASVLGGIKVGSGLSIDAVTGVLSTSGGGGNVNFKSIQEFTATAGQTTFTIAGGYTAGNIDVFVNGVYLSTSQYTATNLSTVVLADATSLNDVVTVFLYGLYSGISTYARNIDTLTATAGQTVFTTSYIPGQIDIFYNGSKLSSSEFTAINGTSVTLTQAAAVGDILEVVTYLAGAGLNASRTITINGVTYDLTANRSWSTLPTGGVAGQLLAKVDDTDYNTQWVNQAPAASYTSQVKHQVKAGEAINKGQAVFVSSANGTNMIVSKASNATEGTSSKTMGLLETTVSTNGFTNVIAEGLLSGLNTGSANAGDPVWLGTNGDLIYGLVNKPSAPAHLVFIGIVTRANSSNGEIFVKVQNGFEMGELHDYVQNGVQDNYVISYESSTSLYKPKSIATLLGYTPQAALFGTGFVKISGSTISYDNSTYLTTGTASSTYLPLAGGTLTGAVTGTGLTTNNYLTAYSPSNIYYGTQIYGTSGGSRKIFVVGQQGYSDGFTVDYNGSVFIYTFSGGATTFANSVTASSIIKSGGTSSQFLKADGSVDSSTYLTTSSASSTYLPLSGGTLSGALSGTSATFSGNINSANGLGSGITLANGDIYSSQANSEDDVLVNRYGYNGGTTQFRNFRVYDGKSNVIFRTFGSTLSSAFYGNLTLNANAAYGLNAGGYGWFGYPFETGGMSISMSSVTRSGGPYSMSFNSNNGFNFQNASGATNWITINSSGYLGIGVSSPVEVLQVSGNIRGSNRIYLNDGTKTLELGTNYIQHYLNSGAAHDDLLFYTGTTERMRLTVTPTTSTTCLLINKTSAASSYSVQTTSANGAYMASANGSGDANFYSTSPTIGYHIYGDQGGGGAKFSVTGPGKGYFAAGVQFGSGSSTLNYYQEGTWTPQLYAGSTAFTMTGINSGKYIRVGNMVTVTGHIQWSGGSGSGMVKIAGLPFASSGVRTAGSIGAVASGITFDSGYGMWILVNDPGYDFIYIIELSTSGQGYSHTPPVQSSGVIYGFSLTYFIL